MKAMIEALPPGFWFSLVFSPGRFFTIDLMDANGHKVTIPGKETQYRSGQ